MSGLPLRPAQPQRACSTEVVVGIRIAQLALARALRVSREGASSAVGLDSVGGGTPAMSLHSIVHRVELNG